MTKKALCVGINDYPFGKDNDLRGCVNDANNWADVLKNHYDFTDIKIVTDAEATKTKVIAELKALLKGAKSGDILAFTNASHGTYLADRNQDELSYDEALCPYDADSNLLVDDEMRKLFAAIPSGVRLTVVLDSCHSGSGTRVAGELQREGHRIRRRFLSPEVRGGVALDGEEMRQARKKKRAEREKYPESNMKEILLSGCRSNQTSADAFFDGDYHGAMTYHALKAIREANYKLTYLDLHDKILTMLGDEMFSQEPQLEGKDDNKRRQIFT